MFLILPDTAESASVNPTDYRNPHEHLQLLALCMSYRQEPEPWCGRY